MKTYRRDKLRRLVEAGRVVMVGSYHYDDMTGSDRKDGIAIKAAIMPADRSAAVYDGKTAYLYPSDFTGYGRAWQNDDGTIHLHVHSNCNYDFRVVDAPIVVAGTRGVCEMPIVTGGDGVARRPDRVCSNCGQYVWSGRCVNDCQARGFDNV